MLNYKLTEIPDGESHVEAELTEQDLDLGDYKIKSGFIQFDFSRNVHYIKVDFKVQIVTELICDRSLEAFDFSVDTKYQVVFKAEPTEEISDEEGAVRNIDYISNQIHLEEDVRDTILLNIPIRKIHPRFVGEDGEPIDFQDQAFGKSEEGEDSIDPRWEALKKLKK